MLRPVPDPSERDPDRTSCPLGVCEGNGWILQDDNTTIECDCRERQIGKAISRGMGTGIPKKFRGVSFDRKPIADLDPFVLRPVRAFVDDDHVIVHYHVRRWPGDTGWAVIDIFRVEDGLIAEHWDVMQDVTEGGPNPNSPF